MDTLQVSISGAQLALLRYYHDRYDRDHSLTYTFEECLVAGIEAKKRSKEYSEATLNRKKFEKEIAANPAIVLKPDQMLKLMQKYGIGSSNANLEKQVLEAAEKMEEAELEKATAPAGEAEKVA
jgi:hypothetical protein